MLQSPPDRLATGRLSLRRPAVADAEAIFRNYAQDSEVVCSARAFRSAMAYPVCPIERWA